MGKPARSVWNVNHFDHIISNYSFHSFERLEPTELSTTEDVDAESDIVKLPSAQAAAELGVEVMMAKVHDPGDIR